MYFVLLRKLAFHISRTRFFVNINLLLHLGPMSSQHSSKIRSIQTFFTKRVFQLSDQKYRTLTENKMAPGKSLRDLGYDFNEAGQLRKLDEDGETSEEPFQFNVSDNHQECQAHYEEIGDAVTQYIYHILETAFKLIRLPVPIDATPDDSTFIYVSKEYDKKDVLLILIHGSGVVRAGQWARSIIINDNLESGSQIPYIRKAIGRGYGLMILNTNDNYTPEGRKIPNSSIAEEHAQYVWDMYISKASASSILIVAHSYGGVVTVALADKLRNDFEKRVKAIALTDSVHSYSNIQISQYLKEITKNWISSSEPLDTPLNTPDYDIPRVSAGHTKHEMTSDSCIDSVFTFFEKKLK